LDNSVITRLCRWPLKPARSTRSRIDAAACGNYETLAFNQWYTHIGVAGVYADIRTGDESDSATAIGEGTEAFVQHSLEIGDYTLSRIGLKFTTIHASPKQLRLEFWADETYATGKIEVVKLAKTVDLSAVAAWKSMYDARATALAHDTMAGTHIEGVFYTYTRYSVDIPPDWVADDDTLTLGLMHSQDVDGVAPEIDQLFAALENDGEEGTHPPQLYVRW